MSKDNITPKYENSYDDNYDDYDEANKNSNSSDAKATVFEPVSTHVLKKKKNTKFRMMSFKYYFHRNIQVEQQHSAQYYRMIAVNANTKPNILGSVSRDRKRIAQNHQGNKNTKMVNYHRKIYHQQ